MAHNKELAKKQGLSEKDCIAIGVLHKMREQIVSRPDMFFDDKEKVLEVLQGVEYSLQWLWNFPMDKNWHLTQFRLPECLCPYLDNKERAGTGYWVINKKCPYHGDKF